MNETDEARQFLDAAFGQVDDVDDGVFLLWTLPDKISHWYTPGQVDTAVSDVAGWSADRDVYVGVAFSGADRGAHARCPSDETTGIYGLWADVDVAGPEHEKQNLPPTDDDAFALVEAFGPDPTFLIHSGHGLQAWWLFSEPWIFENDDDRRDAVRLSTRWNLTQRVRAQERGWTVDATQDLARLFRLPGTVNRKNADEPVPVRTLNFDDSARYDPPDFDDFIVDDSALSLSVGRRTYTPGKLALDANARPDVDKLDTMRDNDPTFAASWNRERRDLDDQSASAYDLSLASIAAVAGWSDQEIVDLLIASRRKHGDDLKLRQDYYARTIAKARDESAREQAIEELEGHADRVSDATDPTDEHHARHSLVDTLSDTLGVEIVRFVKFTSEPPRYKLEAPTASAMIGGGGDVLSQSKMRAAIMDATKIVIPGYKPAAWRKICASIMQACEEEDVGAETTDAGLAAAWLSDYLSDRRVVDDPDEAAVTSHPFVVDGHAHIFGPQLRQWLWTSRGERVNAIRMGEILRAAGAETTKVNVTVDGDRTSRAVWRLPVELSTTVTLGSPESNGERS